MRIDITGAINRCFFCGKQPKFEEYDRFDGYYGDCREFIIRCENCNIETRSYDRFKALNNWNRLGIRK